MMGRKEQTMDRLFEVVQLSHVTDSVTCPLDGDCACNGYEDANQCNPDAD